MEGISWVACSNGEVPSNAVKGGEDAGKTLYVARVNMFGDVVPGKLVPEFSAAYICHGGSEHMATEYEVLTGADNLEFEWVEASNGEVPENAVEGGETGEGETLYIGRASHADTVTCGKIHPSHKCLYLPYGELEHAYETYEVLIAKPKE